MRQYREYPYSSSLAAYIKEYISEGRSLGFIYDTKAYQLYRFDQYWRDNGYDDVSITSERLEKWLAALPDESRSSHSGRIGAVRSLAEYLNILGIESYVPIIRVGKDHIIPHIMDESELSEFFDVADNHTPDSINPADYRMADEYPIMFRFLYCCGMRNNEVCSLKTTDVNLEQGIITITDGKGQKDRIVYMPEDLRQLTGRYFDSLKKRLGYVPYWFFPGRWPEKHVTKTTLDRVFRNFWEMTEASSGCDKRPTPHSLRHGFVVDRINSWILEGVDLEVMFIYLSKYLGHKDPDESFYYYHLVKDAFRIVRQKDTASSEVIPEVRRR